MNLINDMTQIVKETEFLSLIKPLTEIGFLIGNLPLLMLSSVLS